MFPVPYMKRPLDDDNDDEYHYEKYQRVGDQHNLEDERRAQELKAKQAAAQLKATHADIEPEKLQEALMIPEGWVGSENTFDIIVYVDQHGVCEYNKKTKTTSVYGVNYMGAAPINLSIMRAGEYGISVRGNHRHLFLIETTKQLMSRHDHSKKTVFNGLQQMFRYQKKRFMNRKSIIPQGMTPYSVDRIDEMFDASDGWNYTIDGSTFVNTYYGKDEHLKKIIILYDVNHENIGQPINLKNNTLIDLIEDLRGRGYKNIGIVENSCRYIGQTPRIVSIARTKLERNFPGVMGGNRKRMRTRKARKRRTRKFQ